MKLSAPIFQLKRRAKLMARSNSVPLYEALDQIAREEGFGKWSLLSASMSSGPLSETVLSRLDDGDMLLLAGRPGHGKTKLGLQLLIDAARDARKALLFTLEFTEQQAWKHLKSLEGPGGNIADAVQIFTSDQISAEYIIQHMSGLESGAIAVIDYLQLLDQQRSKPVLSEQLQTLGEFAQRTGVVLGFISQIDRSFETEGKRLPDIGDVRLPNFVDLGLFSKACFLHNGEAQLQDVA
ncbi:DNA helicase [Rhizobium johnstonii]|uniref:DNA helicase n=1 Tax=Rhizobium TaxID=379 RepID=UPI001031B8BD|nr:DNA helicase [Rhizobium leguminosarum]TAV41153.1 DNA helicase [Rhizobium leguminosarum]TBF22335.1 DNA helicase [Rhizobium leguminosarum]TBF65812.1 DNA helicase [Rhizobium leguminosarum]TBG93938.1 DNA helicase [Rhizobium leguminosarum]TBH36474.1 DNA helicase [Rhizobium leguminosarum]